MAAPVVTWRNITNPTVVASNWDLGVLDAGTTSAQFEVAIWNNYNQTADVSDMQDCKLWTRDSNGAATKDLVTQQWVNAWNPTTLTTIQTRVDFANKKPVGTDSLSIVAKGSTVYNAVTSTPGEGTHVDSIDTANKYLILGVANDGSVVAGHAQGNYAHVGLVCIIPLNASAGATNFLVRCSYKYV